MTDSAIRMFKLSFARGRARFGLVEVGSRSIRYLVADFEDDGSYRAIETDSLRHQITSDGFVAADVERLSLALQPFRSRLERAGCAETLIYGTALCRHIVSQFPSLLPQDVVVLTEREEALASWAGGILSVRDARTPRAYTVIDQGAGSSEFVSAEWDGENITDVSSQSLPYGHERLAELYLTRGKAFAEAVVELLGREPPDIERLRRGPKARLYLMGTSATKMAWVKQRRDPAEIYKPYRVNDARLPPDAIFDFHKDLWARVVADPIAARRFLDPRAEDDTELAIILTGSLYQLLVARRLGVMDVRVSGYGLRHGLVYLLRQGALLR